ncbi:hypothetical protein FNV43_RR21918 [Rhamnella rubrinervis]|uniref:Uncharacterized protein n=1 Tax=Rhamnella rubrinervis TaxID=2594499 RepID=A0A8K0GRK8_9ROSA|nr:hypothetical protein FNV43_RR21918 [Rhamnella rubrinervis]
MPFPSVAQNRDLWRLDSRKFNVYEMERDYSGWFVKFRVDLKEGLIEYRKSMMLEDSPNSGFTVMFIVRCEVDEESHLVLHIPGTIAEE